MITSLVTSLTRVLLFWYTIGLLVLFIGDPQWVEDCYARLALYPGVPTLELHGLGTAARAQFHLLLYWTLPVTVLCGVAVGAGFLAAASYSGWHRGARKGRLAPRGEFWGVVVPGYSLGSLPLPTTPPLPDNLRVELSGEPAGKETPGVVHVVLAGEVLAAYNLLSPAERRLCEELLRLLRAHPDHFAGHGHGVGLLEHTLNVMAEAAPKCAPDFTLPLVAALAHDVGKLITFKPDGNGGWKRQGLHSREGARILATLPAFRELPELHRSALILAVKYDHAPNKMPALRGQKEPGQLAMRIINALSQADRTATAAEKDRNLEKLKPEDLLWQDFVDFLREAPIVQRGKKGAANQVNNPPDSPYLYIYEAPWRDAAVHRLPAEVAAALDLTRRDAGKLAKYTRILTERLRKDGLLVEAHGEMQVSDANPLWDIQSGTGEKAVVLRGILVLKADVLWKALNYRLSVKSPFPVQILAPNAALDGAVNPTPAANRERPPMPEVTDGLKLADMGSADTLASLGLTAEPTPEPQGDSAPAGETPSAAPATAKPRTRGKFKGPAPDSKTDDVLGLAPAKADKPAEPSENTLTPEPPIATEPLVSTEQDDSSAQVAEASASASLALAMAALTGAVSVPELPAQDSEPSAVPAETLTEPSVATSEMVAEAPAPEAQAAQVPVPELSRAEKREGLSIADEAACQLYPKLLPGDKYYTEHSRAVAAGLKKPGSRYKGDDKAKQVDFSAAGPRRAKRRSV